MKVLLGITGAIACYKVCSLVRLMKAAGWQVRVVATESALSFVGEITWRTLSQNPVERSAFAESADWHPRHIELADWCDVFVVAPLSANTMAKLAQGLADNLLTQTALANTKPLLLAPSMNTHMWEHPATQANVQTLLTRGAHLLTPGKGDLACGVTGAGRLPEPEELFNQIKTLCAQSESSN
jgi:phosphopantothenoylcysteine decarboxylase/phosphopantothenate--cysteine ligase